MGDEGFRPEGQVCAGAQECAIQRLRDPLHRPADRQQAAVVQLRDGDRLTVPVHR